MYQNYPRSSLPSFGVEKRSPYKNVKQQPFKDQSAKVQRYSAVRSNGKILEQFGAEERFVNYEKSIEKYNEAKILEMLVQDRNSRYKTEMCRNFKERSYCIYGSQCQFAHGRDELRDALRNNKYKTKSCQKYWVTGYCAYGPRCNFLHYESGETDSLDKVTMNQDQVDIVQSTSSLSSDFGKSPVTSDEELAETVEDVLNQIENDKSFCDPKLEIIFQKLKRALPSKRSSTPLLQVSNSTDNSLEKSRTSPLQSELRDVGSELSDLPGFSSFSDRNRTKAINPGFDAERNLKNELMFETKEIESKTMPASKRDIFNVIRTCSVESLSLDESS